MQRGNVKADREVENPGWIRVQARGGGGEEDWPAVVRGRRWRTDDPGWDYYLKIPSSRAFFFYFRLVLRI